MTERFSEGWARLALGVLVAGVLIGLLLPVYSDEVVWRFSSRAAIDGFDKLSADLCGANTLAVPPWFIWPARLYSAWFNRHFAAPGWVRLSGVGYGLALVGLWWRLTARIAPDAGRRATARALMVGLLGLGTLPWLLVWSRPEQPVLLAFTGALMLAAHGWRGGPAQAVEAVALRCAGIVVLGVVALSYHMKAEVLMPAFALCLWTCGRGAKSRWWRLGAVAVLAAFAMVAARYWLTRFSCPGDPVMARNLASQNVSALLNNGRSPLVALAALLLNANLFKYFWLVAPAVKPMAQWLVRDAVTPMQALAWQVVTIGLWSAAALLGGVSQAVALWADWRARRWDPQAAMAALLFMLVCGWGMAQTAKNDYDATFELPLLATAIALVVGAGARGARLGAMQRGLARVLGPVAGLSLALLCATYLPSLLRATHQPVWLADNPHSLPLFGYDAARQQARAAALRCGIGLEPPARRPRGLLVDESSYFAAMDSYRPQFHLGVTGVWHAGIKDPVAYLRGIGSDGAVMVCRNLPPRLRARAKAVGDYCCLGPPDW